MTREKYESLPLSTLKALAKSRNMKGISTLRKEALIERMLEEDQKENQKNMEEPAVLKEEKKTETVQDQNQEPQEKREDGMERQMNALSNLGLLSRFVGMLTDSRSFLSYPRHEYFRRTLCNLIGNDIEQGLLPASEIDFIGREIVAKVAYGNAREFFKF